MIKIRHKQTLIFLLSSLVLNPGQSYAADLMDIFRGARDYSPGWKAKELEHKAKQQGVAAAEAGLYPQIVSSGSIRSMNTSGDGMAYINPVYLDEAALTQCIIEVSQNDSCNPPLIIRDNINDRFETYDIGISLVQPLYNYKLWRRYNRAELLNEASDSHFEYEKQQLMMSIAESYFGVLEAHEQWELSQNETELAESQLELAKKRFQLGLAPQNDVYDVRAALDASKVKLLLAKTALENAQENLMLLTQRRDVSLATLSDNMIIEAPRPRNVEEWVKKGLKYNRTLLTAHSATLAAEQELAESRGGYHPEVALIAGYSVSKNDRVSFENLPSVRTEGIGVQFKYPLYLGGLTTAEVKANTFKLEKALEDFELARREMIGKVRNSYRKVNNDIKGVEAAELAIHSSEKSLEASQAGYRNGTRPLGLVLKAQTDLFKAKKDYSSARYNYILDSLRLKFNAGTLTVEDMQVVNSWLNTNELILPPQAESDTAVGGEENIFY